jgi:GDPmannose 4,6-dehydratase
MPNQKTALITGITGQDGAYLAAFLIEKGYTVHGIKRRASQFNTQRVDHLYEDPHEREDRRFILHYGDLTDASNLIRVAQEVQPDEIYNLAAQEPRQGLLRDSRVHGQCRWSGDASTP